MTPPHVTGVLLKGLGSICVMVCECLESGSQETSWCRGAVQPEKASGLASKGTTAAANSSCVAVEKSYNLCGLKT
jgi:hypothetical protein